MRLVSLDLKNIGPFVESHLAFISDSDDLIHPPVVVITGENGTGKTVILDTIRALFLGKTKSSGMPISNQSIERDIVREKSDFLACLQLIYDDKKHCISSSSLSRDKIFELNEETELTARFDYVFGSRRKRVDSTWNWVIDYWASKLSTDSFDVQSLTSPVVEDLYKDALSGVHENIEVSQLICFFDYLRSSENSKEKDLGEYLFDILKKIVSLSLTNGELLYVSRTTLQPIVSQMGFEVSIDKLSSGNLYLLQKLVSMLGKMYSFHVLNKTPLTELCNAPGILLIDEAENHLHPKWQKIFLPSIQKLFPKLQIIVTTHSPFIVASVENARVFVCKPKIDHVEIVDETATYSNQPIDEILLSPLFGITHPFNQEITDLLKARKQAIKNFDQTKRRKIESKLQEINPNYFGYFDIDEALAELKK